MDYLDIIGKLLGAIAVAILAYLEPRIKRWIESKLDKDDRDKLDRLIKAFVESAEQLYKSEDPNGELRKSYVWDQLQKIGYGFTDEINALIEAEVYRLNKGER